MSQAAAATPPPPAAAAAASASSGPASAAGSASATSGAAGAVATPFGLLKEAQALLRELPALVSDRVELLTLELKRAGIALGKILALLVFAAILGATAWLAAWGVVVGGLVALGLHWAAALAAVVLANLAALAWALARLRPLARLLALPATRRHLTKITPSAEPPTARPPDTSCPR